MPYRWTWSLRRRLPDDFSGAGATARAPPRISPDLQDLLCVFIFGDWIYEELVKNFTLAAMEPHCSFAKNFIKKCKELHI
jgi:hypothetical protein